MKHGNGESARARRLLTGQRRLDQLMHRPITTLPGWEEADAVD
jgi:hypothetical protein